MQSRTSPLNHSRWALKYENEPGIAECESRCVGKVLLGPMGHENGDSQYSKKGLMLVMDGCHGYLVEDLVWKLAH